MLPVRGGKRLHELREVFVTTRDEPIAPSPEDSRGRAAARRIVQVLESVLDDRRARLALLLDRTGAKDEARVVYAQIVKQLDGAPARYQKAQKEWGDISKKALR